MKLAKITALAAFVSAWAFAANAQQPTLTELQDAHAKCDAHRIPSLPPMRGVPPVQHKPYQDGWEQCVAIESAFQLAEQAAEKSDADMKSTMDTAKKLGFQK